MFLLIWIVFGVCVLRACGVCVCVVCVVIKCLKNLLLEPVSSNGNIQVVNNFENM